MATMESSGIRLDEIVEAQGPLTVLVVSDNPDYRSVASDVFSSRFFQAQAVNINEARAMAEGNPDGLWKKIGFKRKGEEPDVIIVNIIENGRKVGEQLDLAMKLSQRYHPGALIATVDEHLHRTLFGKSDRNDAHASLLEQIERSRPNGITEAFRLTFPDGKGTMAAQQTWGEELARLSRDALRPAIQRKIIEFRADKYMCQLFCVALEGTSSYNSNGIKMLNSRQMPLAFISSNAPMTIREIVQGVGAARWYSFAHEGALVTDMHGKTEYERRMPAESAIPLLTRIDDIRREYPSSLMVNYFRGDTMFTVRDERVADLLAAYTEKNGGQYLRNWMSLSLDQIKGLAAEESPHRIEIVVRPGLTLEGLESLKRMEGLTAASYTNHYQFTHPDATRAKALEAVTQKLGIDLKRTAYLGAGASDVEALGLVGHPFIQVTAAARQAYKGLPSSLKGRIVKLDPSEGDIISGAIGHLESRKAYRAA